MCILGNPLKDLQGQKKKKKITSSYIIKQIEPIHIFSQGKQ